MEKRIFDDRGFITKEAKAFIDDGFTKEVKRVLATATSYSDVLVISSILKTIVGEHTANFARDLTNKPKSSVAPTLVDAKIEEPPKSDIRLVRPENHKNKVLQFPVTPPINK